MRLVVLLLVILAGCTTHNPASCAENNACTDPARPFCDVDGSIGGLASTCIAVTCTAGTFAGCRTDRALTCNADGTNYDLVACPYGCGATGCNPPPPCTTPDCQKHIIPKYLPTECDTLSSVGDLTISADTNLDTSVDANCTSVVSQSTGPAICVMHYATITIMRSQIYTVRGTRALALVADQVLLVDGILDVGSVAGVDGPGGGSQVSGESAAPTTDAGGGAGYRHVGGAGGSSTVDGGNANGGAAGTSPKLLAELFGGPRSNTGAHNGGGAATVISCRGEVSLPGLIDANGGGGPRAAFQSAAVGGGAGGTVVLQGMMITVSGEAYANGGGGGGGGGLTGTTSGSRGNRSTAAASGGSGSSGDGGYGGTSFAPGYGKAGGGAGGGSAGFLLTLTPIGVVPNLNPLAVSPGFESNDAIATN